MSTECDEECQHEEFLDLICLIFALTNSVVKSTKFQENVSLVLTDLLYITIIYMQITKEQETDWKEDPEKFVEAETECGVRTRGQEILSIIGEKFGEQMLPHLSAAITKLVTEADNNRAANLMNWWKVHEATMLAVGSYKGIIETCHEDLFNLGDYLSLVRGLLQQDDVSPYLTGRCLRILSQYVNSKVYNTQMLNKLIENVLNALGPEQEITLKICAATSVDEICSNLKEGNEEHRQCVSRKLVELFEGIFPIVDQIHNTVVVGKTLIAQGLNTAIGKIFETFSIMLSFDQGFAVEVRDKIILLSTDILLKYPDDIYITDMVQDVIQWC